MIYSALSKSLKLTALAYWGFLKELSDISSLPAYLDLFTDKINAVTTETATDAMRRRINPDALLTIIVGGEGDTKKKEAVNGKTEG